MIPNLKMIDEEKVGIPILGTSDYVIVEWKEDEDAKSFLKKFNKWSTHYSSLNVWGQHDEDSEYRTDGTFHFVIYEIERDDKEYFLISMNGITEFDCLKDCVCIPRNQLNLLKFFTEYALPFSNKNLSYFYG